MDCGSLKVRPEIPWLIRRFRKSVVIRFVRSFTDFEVADSPGRIESSAGFRSLNYVGARIHVFGHSGILSP